MSPRCRIAILSLLSSKEVLNKNSAAEKVFCSVKTAQRILTDLHSEKLIRICMWHRSAGRAIPTYCIADGLKDVQQPKPLTTVQRSYMYRLRKRDETIAGGNRI